MVIIQTKQLLRYEHEITIGEAKTNNQLCDMEEKKVRQISNGMKRRNKNHNEGCSHRRRGIERSERDGKRNAGCSRGRRTSSYV